MSETKEAPKLGTIGWMDLTVDDAPAVRDFYSAVVGLEPVGVDMGGYEDFTLLTPGGGEPVGGVCHARGPNADLPAVWIPYFLVGDIEASVAECAARGGSALTEIRSMGASRYCVIRDPAGATCALYQP